ncbi:PP2C family protein-serine/threonine phosphatase [Aeromicrobium massiliense]|uniref:PP2C family protein-serine/threonine phosphatase n=1 Tax=Aeromicrobium massiliense TaxID=1464554 RepID=UPI00067641FA|nr:protein phosphatase 2C domain-containing protein [Aeromicrobium massiliense]
MALTYRYVALTDTGRRRSDNQDSGYASPRLLALADGMGGAAAGDLASSTTIQEIRKLDQAGADDQGEPIELLAGAVANANHALADLIADDPAVEGMGTTLEALLWDGQRFAWAHIGDSRAYRLRDGVLEQISDDHTFVQSLVDEGRLTPAEARVHPHRSLILRALLGRDDNDPDLSFVEPRPGDRYLLCSDGLSDMVDDATIEKTLALETIDVAATELVRLALEAGGHDNITVVIAEMVEDDAEPDETLASADGRPQLVGAAAGQPRPRTGHAASGASGPPRSSGGSGSSASAHDPEELRYAPRPPRRGRWLRRVLLVVLVLLVLVGAGVAGYRWTQTQYFVALDGDTVAVYRGVQVDLPGLDLSSVDERTDIDVDMLPAFSQTRVRAGIEATSRKNALAIVENLDLLAVRPTPTPTPAPATPTTGTTPKLPTAPTTEPGP